MITDMTSVMDNITRISCNKRSTNYKTVMENYFVQGKYGNICLLVEG